MNIESSRISTIFNSAESEAPAKLKSTFKGATSIMEVKKKKQGKINPNDLNTWEICNPDEFEDKLPQPFKHINKLIYKTILGKVNSEIERIDKAKLSHNYEKKVREIGATNFFDFNGISCFANHKSNPQNSLLVGDKFGNVLLLDLNKRSLTTKKEIIPERRIIDISAMSIPFEDNYLTTFSVILHATQEVFIYRYKIFENVMKHCFIIKCAKGIQTVDANTDVGEFPFKAMISPDCLYISIILYNGNVEVYKIPEPFVVLKEEEPVNYTIPVSVPKTTKGTLSVPQNTKPNPLNPTLKIQEKNQTLQTANSTPHSDIIELFPIKKIVLKSPEIPKDPREALLAFLNPPEVEANPVPEKGKDAKDKKATDKKSKDAQASKEEIKVPSTADLLKKEFSQNPIRTFQGLKRSSEGDHSENVEPPLYYPDLYYLSTSVVVQDTNLKQFSFEKVVELTSDIVCVWRHTTTLEVYELDPVSIDSVPVYILASIYQVSSETSTQGMPSEKSLSNYGQPKPKVERELPKTLTSPQKRSQQQPNVEAKILQPTYTFSTIYPIVCSASSKSNGFLGLGLKDGSVIVWDLILNQQKYVLDKHNDEVTALTFFEDWRLISGAKDGTVHLFDLQNPQNNIKYQHLFQTTGNSIVEISVNDTGIAFAIDNQKNLRAYDLFHFNKLFKVFPIDPRGKNVSFCLLPTPLLNAGKEQLCIVVDENDQNDKNQSGDENKNIESQTSSRNWSQKRCILIYRILDNLLTTFPGLASIVKKGIEKSKAMVAFSKLTIADLNNPNFELPLLETGHVLNKQGDDKSRSNSRLSYTSISGSKINYGRKSSASDKLKEPSLSDLNQTYTTVDRAIRKRKVSPAGSSSPKKALTHANLHPEKYLTEKQSFPKPGLVVPLKSTMDKLRGINQDKPVRTEKLQQYSTQVQEELDKNEELNRLTKRKQMLKETGR